MKLQLLVNIVFVCVCVVSKHQTAEFHDSSCLQKKIMFARLNYSAAVHQHQDSCKFLTNVHCELLAWLSRFRISREFRWLRYGRKIGYG